MSLSKLFQLALPITRRIHRNQLYAWIMAVSQQLDEELPGPLSLFSEPADGLRSGVVLNSMCEPNLSFPEWIAVNNTRRFAHMATDQTNLDATQLNQTKNSAGNGEFRWVSCLVPGANGATFSIDLAEPTSLPVTIQILDQNLVTVLASKVCATTPAFQTFSVSLPANTGLPQRNYAPSVLVNVGAVQASPFAANAQFTPTFATAALGTGTFAPDPITKALNFQRISLSQALAVGNQLAGTNGGIYPFQNSQCGWTIELNGLSTAVEAFNLANDGLIWTFLDGAPHVVGAPIPNGAFTVQDFTWPALASKTTRNFRVRAGAAAGPISNGQFGTAALITAPRALYVPAGVSWSFIPQRGRGKCFILGDSIANGFQATSYGYQGWAGRFREWYPGEVILDAVNSQGLLNYLGTAAPPQDHPDLQLKLAQYCARSNPTDVIVDLSANDYFQATGVNLWTAAAYQTALLGFVVDLMALAPQARIWLKSMNITGVEGVANAAGSTPPNYRTATQAVVTTVNDPRVIFIDGLGALMPVAGDLADVVHPNTVGQQKQAEGVIAAFVAQFAI